MHHPQYQQQYQHRGPSYHHQPQGFQVPYSPQQNHHQGYVYQNQPVDYMTQEVLYNTIASMLTPQLASILLDEYLRVTPINPQSISLRQVLYDMKIASEYYAQHILRIIGSETYTTEVLKFALKTRLEHTINAVAEDAQMSSILKMHPTHAGLLETLLDDEELVRTYQQTYQSSPMMPIAAGVGGTAGNSPYRSSRAQGAYQSQQSIGSTPVTPLHPAQLSEAKKSEVNTPTASLHSVPSWASMTSSWADEVEIGDDEEDIGMEDMLDLAKQHMETQESNLSEFDAFLNSIGFLHFAASLKEIRITDMATLRSGIQQQAFRRVVPLAAERERFQAALDAVTPATAPPPSQNQTKHQKPLAANYISHEKESQRPAGLNRPLRPVMWDEAKEQNRTLYVRGLSQLSDEQIRTYFGAFGEVLDMRYIYEHNTQKFLGYAFIMFATAQQVETVLKYPGSHVIDGFTVHVKNTPGGHNFDRDSRENRHRGERSERASRDTDGPISQGRATCKFFKMPQGCKYGSSCTFVHS